MTGTLLSWVRRYERHLSAGAMVAGFIADSILFERVDLWQTHVVFITYTGICFASILLLHWFETRANQGKNAPRWRLALPLVTQFALGGFWSGFVIFYGRSASIGASWPFLLFLVLVLIGSEYFNRYHSRLVFTSVLFFFALYSYAIFALPIVVGSMGTLVFFGSGLAAIAVFAFFTGFLRLFAGERFYADVWRIRVGGLLVLVAMNFFYFTNILPPLPLATKAAGVYHAVWRVPGDYRATEEARRWHLPPVFDLLRPVLHLSQGDSLSVYSSIFAPTTLATTVTHRWFRYDTTVRQWVEVATIAYPIVGGRDGGYRGYSTVDMNYTGKWRVDIETADGRLITRVPFTVEFATVTPPLETVSLP